MCVRRRGTVHGKRTIADVGVEEELVVKAVVAGDMILPGFESVATRAQSTCQRG